MKLLRNGKVGVSNLSFLGYRYSQLNIMREHIHHYGCYIRILLFYVLFFILSQVVFKSLWQWRDSYSINDFLIITSLREIIFICFKQIIGCPLLKEIGFIQRQKIFSLLLSPLRVLPKTGVISTVSGYLFQFIRISL